MFGKVGPKGAGTALVTFHTELALVVLLPFWLGSDQTAGPSSLPFLDLWCKCRLRLRVSHRGRNRLCGRM